MTYFPDYFKTYPNMNTSSPLHISLNTLPRGFRPHRHDFLEFSYVIDGTGSEAINEKRHPMSPGTFTFVLPYQVHEIFTAEGSQLQLFNCNFSMELLMEPGTGEGLHTLIDLGGDIPYVQLSGAENERMKGLIEDMYREYQGHQPWRQTMLQLRLKEILVLFDRARTRSQPELTETSSSRKGASLWPIIHYIHKHYQDDLALSDLAKQFSMSMSRISELIKETTGQTFVHFLRDLRIRHACGLLASTDMSVTEIAMEVGYGSYKTFSRAFRESRGLAPKDYRKLKGARLPVPEQ